MDLPLAEERVQHRPDIIHGAVAGELNVAGFDIDLDLGDMRARGEGRGIGRAEIGALGKAGFDIFRQLRRLEGLPGDLLDRDGAVGACDREAAGLEDNVVRRRLTNSSR